MVAYIVVPEGLAYQMEQCLLSDYYEAVLNSVIQTVPPNSQVFLAPGNQFSCAVSEEFYAAKYLQNQRPDLSIIVPSSKNERTYKDTFDNARILRNWLQKQGQWNLTKVTLYCNAPHCLRSAVLFRLCGFNVQSVVSCRPVSVQRQMVPRLWFYDYLPIQLLYEAMALVHNLGRWTLWKIK